MQQYHPDRGVAWLCAFSQGHLTACSSLLIEPLDETLSKYSKYPSTCSSFKNCLWQEGCEACGPTTSLSCGARPSVQREAKLSKSLGCCPSFELPNATSHPRLLRRWLTDLWCESPLPQRGEFPLTSSEPWQRAPVKSLPEGKGLGHVCGNERLCHQR